MNLPRIIASLIILTILAACNPTPPPPPTPASPPAPATPTEVAALPTPTTKVEETRASAPTSTLTPPPPTPTRTPVVTLTPTPSPTSAAPTVKNEPAAQSINVRAGPGTNYPVVGQLAPGQEAPVTGRSEAGDWWQIALSDNEAESGWLFGGLVTFAGDEAEVAVAAAPPPPPTATPAPTTVTASDSDDDDDDDSDDDDDDEPSTPAELADDLRCGKDFCVTYQAMVPIWENGGCVGNHSIYITVLHGPPPGQPLDGVVIGDTFGNVEVASGSHGPGRTEITLWSNAMSLVAKRHIDDTPYTSEESFAFTSFTNQIPAEVLAANGYCDGSLESCRQELADNHMVCWGHYSWRVTFHKFD